MRDGAPTYFLFAVWGIFKRRVSGKMGRMKWINSMACSFCWFKFLLLLSLWRPKFYCSC